MGGWAAWVLVAALATATAEEDHWSRPATPERRAGDWVPLSCANCRPVQQQALDQSVQASSNGLPSVLTPPPRAEEARLLPPPPPPDGLFQQAATGFLQAFTQQQSGRKPQQFLQETSQSINRPQAQFLKSNGPIQNQQQFLREPSQGFTPPQDPFGQQFSTQPYLNQPLLLQPQFLGAPFFPQGNLPPQSIQQINPLQIQPLAPVQNQNFQQAPVDRPLFTQQITSGGQQAVGQTVAPQQQSQFTANVTDVQKDENEKEEVQLLYVPVETLNQRARGKQKSLSQNSQQTAQTVGSQSNQFTSPAQAFESSTRKPILEEQENFNVQTVTAKNQYNVKQNLQLQQQLPPEDQEKFNSQTHSVAQQFTKQADQFQQSGQGNLKLEAQNTKQQYNFKLNDQFQPQSQFQQDQGFFNPQFAAQQNPQFQPLPNLGGFENIQAQDQFNFNDQFQQSQLQQNNFNNQFDLNQQIRAQQNLNTFQQVAQLPQDNNQQFNLNQDVQFQQFQGGQQAFSNPTPQPYLNQQIQLNQEIRSQQVGGQQQFAQPQTEAPVPQQTEAPVPQTTVYDTTTEQVKKQRFRTHQQQDHTRNVQQHQANQFTKKFPQDYQQTSFDNKAELASQTQDSNLNQQNTWTSNRNSNLFAQQGNVNNQQVHNIHSQNQFNSGRQHVSVSSVAPSFSTPAPVRTTPAPNQPPLSVYMETTEESKVNDVLRLLKNAKSIQVLDTIGPESPQVFVGPSNLKPPTGYIKFELPYLNAIESNRVERKVDKLPFFVAPLNFNPPPGYSKIPFPAPHIGSVVVSNVTVLKTALHEKPYENHPVQVSSTQRYQEQYTLPPAISPISPQLPSLINSLKEEIYSGSTPSSSFPAVETETTTVPYTTTSYRGRGSSRASQRVTSNYTPPTRRPQTRTRRPYDGRPHSRRVTTTTTTEEPSTQLPVQHFTPQPDQGALNSEAYNVQNTVAPVQSNGNDQVNLHSGNVGNIYNEDFLAKDFHNQFNNQQQFVDTQNSQQGSVQNVGQQYNQNIQASHGHSLEPAAQTTTVSSVASQSSQSDDFGFKSQRVSGTRREPTRQHQRFRGRQRLTTTTTEVYEEPPPPPQEVSHQFNAQTESNLEYQNRQQHRDFNQGHLVENTHFQANVPQQNFNIQTERSDVELHTTERLVPSRNEQQQFGQQGNNQFNQQSFEHSQFRQPENFQQDQRQLNVQQGQFQSQFNNEQTPQPSISEPINANQFQQLNSQRGRFESANIQHHENNAQSLNFEQNHRFNNQGSRQSQQSFDQQRVQQEQAPLNNQQYINDQQFIPANQEQPPQQSDFNNQFLSSGQFGQVFENTAATPQEVNIPTTEATTVHIQPEQEVPQHNQQRLKYNRPHGRVPVTVGLESTTADYQPQVYSTDSTTALDATTRASLVRVRGRVRSRQRGAVRQSTTTEEPNYPTSYLHRQKSHQDREEKESQDYIPKKRVNYNQRPAYTSIRNKEVEQSTTEQTEQYEGQSVSERFNDYTEASTTTTTEAPSEKPGRRYNHILNRNKIRRTRPDTASTAGSSGTTKFLRPTTPPPVTRLPGSTRGRIRKPVATKATTTELPQANPSWTDRDNYAPSAGSNEISEVVYQPKHTKTQQNFGFQRQSITQNVQPKTSPRPASADADDDYWNQGVTIQQSTSFDFKPDVSAVTPSSFKENDEQFQGTFSPIWNGQIELQDGNYFDVFNQQVAKQGSDQTPFSSDQQKIVYQDIKNRRPIGKDNQYPEKTHEVVRESETSEDEGIPKVYPVYQETPKLPQTIEEEMPHEENSQLESEKKKAFQKHNEDSYKQNIKSFQNDEATENTGSEYKEGALKRKIVATNSVKKGGRRRGNWVRVRVRKPQDVFETAESQNLAKFSENSIQGVSKTGSNKLSWSAEPITEQPEPTTSTEVINEPVENVEEPVENVEEPVANVNEPEGTITFEQALKDMLKEFITNPEEGSNDDVESETESSTEVPESTESTNSTEEIKHEEDDKIVQDNTNEDFFQHDSPQEEPSNSPVEESKIQREVVKAISEVTTEAFTQEPTTVFQPVESETTLEPEVTTVQNEQVNGFPLTRVLGTSTTTKISLETEICYRGRCVKTKKLDTDGGDLTMSE